MRKQIALAVALVLAAVGFDLPSAAQAATTGTHARVAVVEASANWLIYKRQVSRKNLQTYPQKDDVLYATNGKGSVKQLAGFTNGYNGDTAYLVGNTVAQAHRISDQNVFQQRVRYLDLATGETASVNQKINDFVVSAAPGGWVVKRDVGDTYADGQEYSLTKIAYNGVETAYNSPFPERQEFVVRAADSGLLATTVISDEIHIKSQARFMSWSKPGTWQTIFTGPVDSALNCALPSATQVACSLYPGEDSATTNTPAQNRAATKGAGLLSLTGGAPHWLKNSHPSACQKITFATVNTNLEAIETSSAGTCTAGKLYRFGADKTLTSSKSRHYNVAGSVTAGLRGLLVSSPDQRVIYRLTGVGKTPVVVART